MLVPLEWLKEYVDINLDAKQLADRLTASGSSVERIYTLGEGLDDLIVAEVLSVDKHPNADRLRVAQVSTGSETLEVVCGAPNLAAGQHVVFAPVGAHVPIDMHSEDRGPFTLTRAKIRGVESNGMICSTAELGLGEDHSGILVLPPSTTVGQPIAKALDYPQTVFDIEVTTNRVDELSMIGLAREISALTQTPLKTPEVPKVATQEGQAIEPVIKSDGCFRMVTQSMEVVVGPSPWWMQRRLAASGMRPINNVVDITNYVMLEFGQPLHAYDTTQLHGATLIARQATSGETIQTLDGETRELSTDMLVIADQNQPVGIAGIMGGMASKTEVSTKYITLEAACFDPVSIRKTANALALRSEASRRFERMVDRSMSEEALDRAVELLARYAQGKRIGPKRDTYPQPPTNKQISLSEKKLNQYMGKQFDFRQASEILNTLGFKSSREIEHDAKGYVLTVNVPSWRLHDVDEEVDLIEEVVRMVGYDQLPLQLPDGQLPQVPLNQEYRRRHQLKLTLSQGGWSEVLTNSLTTASSKQDQIAIANPLSSEWTHLRRTLLDGLLVTARQNRNYAALPLFELSSVYIPQGKDLPQEKLCLTLLYKKNLPTEQNFSYCKGTIEAAFSQLGVALDDISYSQNTPVEHLDHRDTATIALRQQPIGIIGRISDEAARQFDVEPSTILAELDVSGLLSNPPRLGFVPLPKYPAVEEDLSLLMDEGQSIGPPIAAIKQLQPLIESITIPETYRDASLGVGKKAPLLHLTYRSPQGTLTAAQVTRIRQAIIAYLQKEDIHVRE